MASLARLELVTKFRKELDDYNAFSDYRAEKNKDTTHIQMASVDEMMSAYGYVPRRLPNYPAITDGRFGYVLAHKLPAGDRRSKFMSFEAAVRMHNGEMGFYTTTRARYLSSPIAFARRNRIVETVGLQRNKRIGNDASGLTSQIRWVKFLEENNG